MNEISEILSASNAPMELKTKALSLAFEIAGPIAAKGSGSNQAGEFMSLLLELLKLLLPLLLKLLMPMECSVPINKARRVELAPSAEELLRWVIHRREQTSQFDEGPRLEIIRVVEEWLNQQREDR